MPSNDDISAIVRALARYMGTHPQASDTLQGIERWWLEPRMNARQADVNQALLWLTRQGLVGRIVAADGRVRYHRLVEPGDIVAVVESRLTTELG